MQTLLFVELCLQLTSLTQTDLYSLHSRVWDLIFVLGTVMLFRVAVAIIQMNRAEILACDSAASLYALMRSMTTHLYQVDKLLKVSFSFSAE